MVIVSIRKQGGAAVVTNPSAILRLLNLEVGARLELNVKDGKLVASPVEETKPKRYTLEKLLKGATEENMRLLNEDTVWALDENRQGRELI